ncbi:hypothetical protein [Streptomyces bluensis]|uniref:Uncharacterized protein n=1 Tax=Streptomyces bluensis TaxID=33897 RepID=A0ABW6UN94_9ACTN
MGTVTFVDETTSGGRSAGWGIEVAEERLSVGELIRRRVFQEVAEYNARTPEVFQGLVQPKDAERVLNGYAMRTRRRIDPEAQTELALAAFAGNGFLVLVGDRQVTDLEEEVELPLGTEVVFLKLVPLVGG